jgi:hypothetical protein
MNREIDIGCHSCAIRRPRARASRFVFAPYNTDVSARGGPSHREPKDRWRAIAIASAWELAGQ